MWVPEISSTWGFLPCVNIAQYYMDLNILRPSNYSHRGWILSRDLRISNWESSVSATGNEFSGAFFSSLESSLKCCGNRKWAFARYFRSPASVHHLLCGLPSYESDDINLPLGKTTRANKIPYVNNSVMSTNALMSMTFGMTHIPNYVMIHDQWMHWHSSHERRSSSFRLFILEESIWKTHKIDLVADYEQDFLSSFSCKTSSANKTKHGIITDIFIDVKPLDMARTLQVSVALYCTPCSRLAPEISFIDLVEVHFHLHSADFRLAYIISWSNLLI